MLGARFGLVAGVGRVALGRRLVRLGSDAAAGGLGNMFGLGCRHSELWLVLPGDTRGSLKGRTGINVFRPVVRETRVMTPIPRGAIVPPAQAAVTFEKLRRDEAAHRGLEAQQARERATLEKLHDSELRTPPRGLSAPQLLERHQAEHRAFNEHVNRQNHVFEHRQQSSPLPAPQERSSTTIFSQRSGTSRRNGR